MHRQGRGLSPVRVRRQGLDHHHQRPCARRPVRAARQGAARQSVRRTRIAHRHRGDSKAHRVEIERAYTDKGYRAIGHLKTEGHLGRCYLKGRAGDAANAILSAVGYNFRRILAWLRIVLALLLAAIIAALASSIKAQSRFITDD